MFEKAEDKAFLDLGGIIAILLLYNPIIKLPIGSSFLSFFGFELYIAPFDANYVIRLDYYLLLLAVLIIILMSLSRINSLLRKNELDEKKIGSISVIGGILSISVLIYYYLRTGLIDSSFGNIFLLAGSIMMITSGLLFLKESKIQIQYILISSLSALILIVLLGYFVDIGIFAFLN